MAWIGTLNAKGKKKFKKKQYVHKIVQYPENVLFFEDNLPPKILTLRQLTKIVIGLKMGTYELRVRDSDDDSPWWVFRFNKKTKRYYIERKGLHRSSGLPDMTNQEYIELNRQLNITLERNQTPLEVAVGISQNDNREVYKVNI